MPLNNHTKYKCPCCGNYTLEEEHMWEVCPVCFWEDDNFIRDENDPSGSNYEMTLKEARENYKRIGACCEDNLEFVRKPTEDEEP